MKRCASMRNNQPYHCANPAVIVLILLWAEGALTSRLPRHQARLNHRPRSFRAAPADRFEAAPAQTVVVDEERLDLIQEARTQFIQVLNMSMRAGADGDRKEAVVALRPAVRFALLGL